MNTVGQIWRRLLSLMRRGRLEREMEDEMRFHLEMQIEQNLVAGMAPRMRTLPRDDNLASKPG